MPPMAFSTTNASGVWCNYCGEMIIPRHWYDSDDEFEAVAMKVTYCDECGADEDGPGG